jgi:hypothetical protein
MLGVVGIVTLSDTFGLEAEEEAFHDGVVPAVGAATHAADDAVLLEHGLVEEAGVLAAAVGVDA